MAGLLRGVEPKVVWLCVIAVVMVGGASEGAWDGDDLDGTGAGARFAVGGPSGERVVRLIRQKKTKKKARPKAGATQPEAGAADTATSAGSAAAGELKFSRDIAPIFVANCAGCHNPRQKRGKFDLSTFEKLMDGTPDEKVIVPGKPEESHLVLRIKGLEKPKMPQGANRSLSDEVIARIERWVKAGAVLDAGVDRTALLEKIAASPEELRKAELARKSPEERDKQVEAVGLERWKKANPKVKPEVTPGSQFLLFGNLPKDRASAAIKAVEGQLALVRSLVGPAALDWGEKGSLYVFNDAASFNEFVRAVETREVEPGDVATARFNVPEPYVAVIDPLKGRDEPPGSSSKRAGRARKGDDASAGGTERSLSGLLTEQFVVGVMNRAGKPPRWLALGLGAQLASRVEPRAVYYQKLRRQAFDLFNQGWPSKANDALGGETKTEDVRAVGSALIGWVNSVDGSALPALAQGLLAGGEKLDEVLGSVLNLNRNQLLEASGVYVMQTYGQGR
jgi:mono/diheme cytochrome c family protein